MSQIDLIRTKPHGQPESFKTEDRIDCTLLDGAEESFEIDPEDFLGCGGNAMVYGCRSIRSGDQYAIKVQIDTRWNRLQRFEREERLLLAIRHAQLMPCVGHGKIQLTSKRYGAGLHPFIIMPLAKSNLFDHVKQERANLSFERLAGQFRGLSEALAVLHERAIHRDIKPENVLLCGETWMLADFGLCKFLDPVENGIDITVDQEKIGPVFWMSPESMNRALGCRDEITKASDVFQLAAVFWFAATGRHPTGIVKKTDWKGPPKVFDVLAAALSHNPSQRPCDGKVFHEQMEDALF